MYITCRLFIAYTILNKNQLPKQAHKKKTHTRNNNYSKKEQIYTYICMYKKSMEISLCVGFVNNIKKGVNL